MGYINFNGYLGIGRQSAQGTGVAPSFFVRFLSGGIKAENVMKEFREGGFNRQGQFSEKVGFNVSAEIEALMRADLAGWLLTMALGSDTVSGSSEPYTHTITPSSLQYWSIETSELDGNLIQRMVDGKVQSLEISGKAEEAVSMKATVLGLDMDGNITAATPSYSTEKILKFLHGTFTTLGGVNAEINEFTLSITNNIETYRASGLTARQILEKGLQVSLDFKFKTTQADEYKKVYFGGASGTSPSETAEASQVILDFSVDSGADLREVKITIPQVTYSAMELPGLNADGEVVMYGATGIATYDGSNDLITAEVKNADSTAYDGS